MNISKKFNLPITGHKDIEFVDIDEIEDTKLFLDPYVIQALSDEFCIESSKAINSFFLEIFLACRKSDKERLMEILRYASEPNETNLGMKSISKYGKGATAKELTTLFLDFYKVILRNPHIETNPLALCIYIQNFDKDKMSDLITNIIRNLLYEFTVQQCEKWNISLSNQSIHIGNYWDYQVSNWKKLYGQPLIVGQKSLLLVPKHIVRTRYVFNVECYIQQYILKTIQEYHLNENTELCTIKEYVNGKRVIIAPTKKVLYKREVYGNVHKTYAFTYSTQSKLNEINFINDISKRISEGYGTLNDTQLDKIVYKKYINVA